MRKRKKKSGFQKLTIVMAWFMAVITLLGVVATAFNFNYFTQKRSRNHATPFCLKIIFFFQKWILFSKFYPKPISTQN